MALMSLSFWKLTQMLICMRRPRRKSASRAPLVCRAISSQFIRTYPRRFAGRRGRGALQVQRLANVPFFLPILCPADGVGPVDGVLRRKTVLPSLLPLVGPGWYPKVLLAATLDLNVCRWNHIVLGISARSHVNAATLRRALEQMDKAWFKGKKHMAKLSVNAIL